MAAQQFITDAVYEQSRPSAENRYFLASVKWLNAVNDELSKYPAEKPNVRLILEQTVRSAWRGVAPATAENKPRHVPFSLSYRLFEICRDLATAELSAFAELQVRQGLQSSQIAIKLESHCTDLLTDIGARCWRHQFSRYIESFDGVEQTFASLWSGIAETCVELIRDRILPRLFSGESGKGSQAGANPFSTTGGRTIYDAEHGRLVHLFDIVLEKISLDAWLRDHRGISRTQATDYRAGRIAGRIGPGKRKLIEEAITASAGNLKLVT